MPAGPLRALFVHHPTAAMFRQIMLFTHLAGVVIWVGGMFFAYFCLRPAAAELLEPPKRLPLWTATFTRFLPIAAVCVALIVASGLVMMLQVGMKFAPLGWHVMFALGLLMSGVFVAVYVRLFPRLRRHSEAGNWPEAAKALNAIRQMVAVNLVLSVGAVAAVAFAR